MKLAFVILSCDYPTAHFNRLLQRLSMFGNSAVYIHHDYSQNQFDNSLKERYNIVLSDKTYITHWSHINNVKATWDIFKNAMNGFNPDWIITITPTCYPVKTVDEIESFLQDTEYDGFMTFRKVTSTPDWELDKWIYRDMYHHKITLPIINRPIYVKRKASEVPFNSDFAIWHGSNYFMLNNKAVSSLLGEEATYQRLVHFYDGFKTDDQHPCPQEIVIQSILMNNCKHLKINGDYLRFIKWREGIWSPEYLDEKYFNEIRSSNALFARKFKSPLSDSLTDLIDNTLLNKKSI